jgi:hypothetical protein
MIQIFPIQPITVGALPPSAPVELAGQLQRCADALERLVLQTQVNGLLLSQLSQPLTDDPDTLANLSPPN